MEKVQFFRRDRPDFLKNHRLHFNLQSITQQLNWGLKPSDFSNGAIGSMKHKFDRWKMPEIANRYALTSYFDSGWNVYIKVLVSQSVRVEYQSLVKLLGKISDIKKIGLKQLDNSKVFDCSWEFLFSNLNDCI